VPDYYAILGVDSGASHESIKIAYRRLARENHPDRNVNSNENQKSGFAMQMLQLNEAYAVLSDSKRRREYDEKLRVEGILSSRSHTATVTTDTKTEVRPSPPPKVQVRSRPHTDAEASIVSEYGGHLRAVLQADKKKFSWKKMDLDGFDWGLEASFWTSHYCVALRGFADLNAAAAKKFLNYAQIAIARGNRQLKKSYFLFLIPFHRLTEWDSVSVQCQQFVTDPNHTGLSKVPGGILLLDMQRSRTLRFGPAVDDERFQKLVEYVGTPR
jgi:curved DNA-binding protein CbpA